MLIIIISRSSLKLDHVGSKTRLLGHQATQVSDLGPLWPSCLAYFTYPFKVSKYYVILCKKKKKKKKRKEKKKGLANGCSNRF